MAKKDEDKASMPDGQNPEWTRDEMRRARPALDVLSEAFGSDVAASLKRGRGRPEKPDKKISQTLRLDAEVLETYRNSGRGWQSRINQILREHMHEVQK